MMESNPHPPSDVPVRRLGARSSGPPPELCSYEDAAGSYYVETAERPELSEGLLSYWRLIFRHKVPILAASIGGLLLGVLAGAPLKPVYRASTTLEVMSVNEDFMNMRPTQPTIPGADTDNLSEEETQATLLQTPELTDRVFALLDPNPTPPQPLATTGWRRWLHLKVGPGPTARENLLAGASKSLKVVNPPRTRILNISVDSKDSQLALEFTNTLVQEFIKQNIDARWESTHQTGDWLGHEINDARTKLQDSEDALQSYANSSGLLFLDGGKQNNVAEEKLHEIQQQLSVATADRISKQSAFELARNSPPDALADVLSDPTLQSLTERLDDGTRQVASLSAVYNPGYAKLQQAQAEVASLRQAFESHRADLLQRIETDYQSAARREKLLSATYDRQAREVAGLDQRAIQYNILKREVDSNQQLYDTMLQQLKQASIATALHASNVHIVYPASLLDQPVSPNFKINAAMGLFCGFLCSAGFILFREHTDRTLRQPGEVKQWACLPELGAIPRLHKAEGRNGQLLVAEPLNGKAAAGERRLIPRSPRNRLNSSNISDAPIVPQAFQSALTSILLAGENRAAAKVLVFTSTGPADGKTSVVSNIAVAAAATGKKVLLVDADLRRPRIHELFGIPNEAGLAELLRSEQDFTRWPELTQRSRISSLSIITAGKPRRGAGILFYSPGFPRLIANWREQFDLVLLDTPPALPITDARVIGILSDGVVLVARAGQTTRDALVALHERLAQDRIHLLGCILNDWDPSQASEQYRYYVAEEETFA